MLMTIVPVGSFGSSTGGSGRNGSPRLATDSGCGGVGLVILEEYAQSDKQDWNKQR